MPTLEQAIKAIKAGDKETGQELLAEILQADLENEKAWLWLSSVVESDERRRHCLERVLEINPDNQAAQRGLAKLPQQQDDAAQQIEAMQAESRLRQAGPLGVRLAAVQQKQTGRPEQVDAPPQAQPTEPPPASEPPPTGQPTPVDEPQIETESRPIEPPPPAFEMLPEPAPSPTTLSPAGQGATIDSGTPTSKAVGEPLPATGQTALHRLAEFSKTGRGRLVIGSGLAGLLLICAACVFASLVSQSSSEQIPAPLAAVLGLDTPTPVLIPTPTDTPLTPTNTPTVTPGPILLPTLTATPINTLVVASTSTATPIPSPVPTFNPNFQTGLVVGVVAGDTIDVMIDGVEYRVKYILVDVPKVDDPEHGTEPFGPEALELNRSLVAGQTVTLEKDVSHTDEFGRLLRYVYVGDLMVNEELLRHGVARVLLNPPDLKYGARFQEVEQAAQVADLGIWGGIETGPESAPPLPSQLVIVAVNHVEEYVDIQNIGPGPQNLAGWWLLSERDEQACPLEGLIQPGETLRIWALLADFGREGYNCGFTQNIWSNTEPDPAVLYDHTRVEVSRLD